LPAGKVKFSGPASTLPSGDRTENRGFNGNRLFAVQRNFTALRVSQRRFQESFQAIGGANGLCFGVVKVPRSRSGWKNSGARIRARKPAESVTPVP
jgi:hypothetical protein